MNEENGTSKGRGTEILLVRVPAGVIFYMMSQLG